MFLLGVSPVAILVFFNMYSSSISVGVVVDVQRSVGGIDKGVVVMSLGGVSILYSHWDSLSFYSRVSLHI